MSATDDTADGTADGTSVLDRLSDVRPGARFLESRIRCKLTDMLLEAMLKEEYSLRSMVRIIKNLQLISVTSNSALEMYPEGWCDVGRDSFVRTRIQQEIGSHAFRKIMEFHADFENIPTVFQYVRDELIKSLADDLPHFPGLEKQFVGAWVLALKEVEFLWYAEGTDSLVRGFREFMGAILGLQIFYPAEVSEIFWSVRQRVHDGLNTFVEDEKAFEEELSQGRAEFEADLRKKYRKRRGQETDVDTRIENALKELGLADMPSGLSDSDLDDEITDLAEGGETEGSERSSNSSGFHT
ncbi:hypothetical protein FN846DRAFT_478101 [Sphaerosporella brunnea]|uniref:Uncharacterized protein n=1 Tax=Sphaerosporella brunnea TaxID=1250544 RepID=A0A5J5FC53_9PEZI|nr:hypothetical protein FN846DRAFT_478101 [Sphaerosporella brunnea]